MTDLSPLFTWRSAIVESSVSRGAKHVALTLSLHMNERGGSCFPSLAVLEAETSLSRSSVVRGLKNLEEAGWLAVDRHPTPHRATKNRYEARIPEGFTTGPFLEKRVQGASEKGSLVTPEDVKRTLNENGSYICERDGLGFKSKLGLERHIRNVHDVVAA